MKKFFFYFNLARLALFQTAFGIVLVLLNDTLNRVMTIELGLSATIAFTLINLKELLAVMGVKVWAGNASDRSHFFGYKRFPYIVLGVVLCVVPFVFAPHAAFEMQTDYWTGLVKLFVIFSVFGFGFHIALTTYYSMIVDFAGREHLGQVASISWTLMVTVIIISASVLGKYLVPFTEEKLVHAFEVAAILVAVITMASTIFIERRSKTGDEKKKSEETLSFAQSLKLVQSSPQTKAFAFYMFISIFAAFGNDLIMEPFGGDVFGMSVAETTLFRRLTGSAQLAFMLLTGFAINKIGQKRAILFGNYVSIAGFVMLIASAVMLNRQILNVSLVVLGVGLGASNIGNITLMMTMTAGRGGLFMGIWGTAQSVAMFAGGTLVGGMRDGLIALTGIGLVAYNTIFVLLIISFIISTVMLPKISPESFESETKIKISEVLSAAD